MAVSMYIVLGAHCRRAFGSQRLEAKKTYQAYNGRTVASRGGCVGVMIDVKTETHGDKFLASVAGEIDAHTVPKLRTCLEEAVADGYCDLVIDLSAVPFIDSTGIGVLATTLRASRENGGGVSLVGVRDNVLRIFALLGLDGEFAIVDDLQSVLISEC